MENNHLPTDMKDRVLGKIRSGEVAMHSKLYFVLNLAALAVVSLLALATSVLLFSFMFFTLRINFHHPSGPFGPGAWFFFTHFFPWHLLLLDIVLVALAEWLMRRFRFAYRSPTLYLLFGLLAFALALGIFVDHSTGFNDAMLAHARQHNLPPPLNDMYEHAHHPEMDVF